MYSFLYAANTNNIPTKHHKGVTAVSSYHDLGVGRQGHLRSNVQMEIESSYMVSYVLLIVTICLGNTIKELQQVKTIVTLAYSVKVI